MLKARGSIELVVRIRKSQPLQKPTRRDVLRVMAGENRPCPADRERMLDDTRGRLERIALSPVPRGDVHAELGNVRVACAHSQAAAAHVLARGNQEEGPILNTVNMLSVELELQPNLHVAQRVTTRCDIPRDGRVAPKTDGERQVRLATVMETQPRRTEEVLGHAAGAASPTFRVGPPIGVDVERRSSRRITDQPGST